nr:integrase, catalytic region, zinc finger, CCHC-type, peptidase aspartic, catalytic [Tanacetum cinerariifolium]
KVLTAIGYQWKPTGGIFTLKEQSLLTRFTYLKVVPAKQHENVSTSCSKHMTGDRSRLMNLVKNFIGTVRFKNDHFGAIIGYGDYVIGDNVISRVYYVEGLGHNLFSVRQFCNSDLEVAFKKHSCYVHDTCDVKLIKVKHQVVDVVTTAKIITEVVIAASATLTAATPQLTTAAAPTLTTAPSAARRRKGVVIRDPEESATPSIIVPEAKSKDKGKAILKEDNAVKRYQALKRKLHTEAQARKNMMIYLRNVAGFKMDYIKGMTYDDIRPIFEKHFDWLSCKRQRNRWMKKIVEHLKG